jgi:membrane fusion protein (multidrug efflux system)
MLHRIASLFRSRLSLAAVAFVATSLVHAAEEEKKSETTVAVQVGKVVRATLRAYVTGYGMVEPAPVGGANQLAGGVRLAPGASGLVLSVHAVEGAQIEKGAVIVELESGAANAAVLRAQAAVTAAQKGRARQVQLQAVEGTSEKALQEVEERLAAAHSELAAAKFQQTQLVIRAPLSGTLTRLRASPGEWLEAGREIGEIVDPDRLVISTQLPVAETTALHTGQVAHVFTRMGADEKPVVEATLQFVSTQVTPGSDAVLVRLALPKGGGVRVGQFVAVRIVAEERAGRLAVPREAVYTDSDGHSTISVVEGDRARQKAVQTGLRDGPLVEITGEGVTEGASVVTVGSYALPKETKVRVLTTTKEGGK